MYWHLYACQPNLNDLNIGARDFSFVLILSNFDPSSLLIVYLLVPRFWHLVVRTRLAHPVLFDGKVRLSGNSVRTHSKQFFKRDTTNTVECTARQVDLGFFFSLTTKRKWIGNGHSPERGVHQDEKVVRTTIPIPRSWRCTQRVYRWPNYTCVQEMYTYLYASIWSIIKVWKYRKTSAESIVLKYVVLAPFNTLCMKITKKP